MDKIDTANLICPNLPMAPGARCPVGALQRRISGKSKLRTVWDLKDGLRRYSEIRTDLLRGAQGKTPVTPRVLSGELKALAQSGLIDRKDYGVVPPPSSAPFGGGENATLNEFGFERSVWHLDAAELRGGPSHCIGSGVVIPRE